MLSFSDFFDACSGFWTTERTYHSTLQGEVERSYTEYWVTSLDQGVKQLILEGAAASSGDQKIMVDRDKFGADDRRCPGFAIAFNTRSEKGEEVSMQLNALFVPDDLVVLERPLDLPPLPLAAHVSDISDETVKGFYLRDAGYSETGAIAGRFTYQPIRQTLEMTTYYNRSVAVDQMRIVAPDMRLRTIVTYQRPPANQPPTIIDLVGFGVERRQATA